jgi:hypothetical protein
MATLHIELGVEGKFRPLRGEAITGLQQAASGETKRRLDDAADVITARRYFD